MAHFASEAELEAFLGKLNPTYGQYATALWSNGITTQRQLANADKEDLLAAGVTSAIHAKDIKAAAGTQGQVLASRSCLGFANALLYLQPCYIPSCCHLTMYLSLLLFQPCAHWMM